MPNHDRRNLLWAAAALLALPLALGRSWGPGALGRLLDAGRRGRDRRPQPPAAPRPRIALPAGSVSRHG